jgi:hypothetical protein
LKYCNRCKLSVNSTKKHCPLCYLDLTVTKDNECVDSYPDLDSDIILKSRYNFIFRLMLFISVVVATTCLFINLLTWSGLLWSLIIVLGIILSWEIVAFLILGKKNSGFKVVCNMIVLPLLLVSADLITGWHQWSVNIVMPLIISASTLTITIILYKKRTKWREYMIYQLIITINGFIPIILYLCGFIKKFWPVGTSLLYAVITIVGIWIFADKQLKNELQKRFHL